LNCYAIRADIAVFKLVLCDCLLEATLLPNTFENCWL